MNGQLNGVSGVMGRPESICPQSNFLKLKLPASNTLSDFWSAQLADFICEKSRLHSVL